MYARLRGLEKNCQALSSDVVSTVLRSREYVLASAFIYAVIDWTDPRYALSARALAMPCSTIGVG